MQHTPVGKRRHDQQGQAGLLRAQNVHNLYHSAGDCHRSGPESGPGGEAPVQNWDETCLEWRAAV